MAKVFPLADLLDFKVDPDCYRMVVGVIELVCGIMLAMIPGTSSVTCCETAEWITVPMCTYAYNKRV